MNMRSIFRSRRAPIWRNVALLLLVAVSIAAYKYGVVGTTDHDVDSITGVETAYEQRRSGVWVNVSGTAVRLLPDDNEGSRHQRFILKLDGGHTLMIAHNIDLATRLPLALGDPVQLRGRYEWNDRGGVVHWTHRDPEGQIAGGWIEHEDRRYQ